MTGTGIAILADGAASNTTVSNTGTITGDIYLGGSGASSLTNLVGGTVNAPVSINLGGGLLRNGGTLQVGGAGTWARPRLPATCCRPAPAPW